MSAVGVLILFSVLGAFICAKARSAVGAVVFSAIALVLFIATPIGQGLPSAISSLVSFVERAYTPTPTGWTQPTLGGGH